LLVSSKLAPVPAVSRALEAASWRIDSLQVTHPLTRVKCVAPFFKKRKEGRGRKEGRREGVQVNTTQKAANTNIPTHQHTNTPTHQHDQPARLVLAARFFAGVSKLFLCELLAEEFCGEFPAECQRVLNQTVA